MALRKPVTSVPEGGNPTLGMEQLPTGDQIRGSDVDGSSLVIAHDDTTPTGTGPEFEHYNTAERAVVDAEVIASAAHRIDTANPHAVTAAQAGAEPANANIQAHIADVLSNPHAVTAGQVGAAPIAHVGAGGVAEHPNFTTLVEGFVPAPGAVNGFFLRDDGVWATPTGTGFALIWRFETSTVMAAPGNTRFRMNNATPASVTALAFDDQTRDGVDASTLLDNLVAGDAIIIQQVNDAAKYIVCDVVLSTDNTGWFQVDVTVADSGTIFDNNQDCVVIITKGASASAAFALALLQIRDTTAQTIGTVWADVTFNTTDHENEAATIEHNNGATDEIDIKVAGYYHVEYDVNIVNTGSANTNLLLQARIRLNNAGTGIVGSHAEDTEFQDNSIEGVDVETQVHGGFYVNAAANDKLTLQLQYVDVAGSGTPGIDTEEVSIKVTQLFRV